MMKLGGKAMASNYFCMHHDARRGGYCGHEQETKTNCERCGADPKAMYPIQLYGLYSAMDGAFNASRLSNDEHMVTAMSRVHEAFENVLYRFKELFDEVESI